MFQEAKLRPTGNDWAGALDKIPIMVTSYELSHLSPLTFEHLVNALALRVLGSGHTGFGPGADGGRDGYFEGRAPYPSAVDCWSGLWYIQSKFHAPHLSKDAEKWLLERIKAELDEFTKAGSRRVWPDNWIVATNVSVSAVPGSGTFDRARALVAQARPELHFDLWNGQKIADLLAQHQEVAQQYGHFLTPGHVISALHGQLSDDRASVEHILRALIVSALAEHKQAKLDHAGAHDDERPGVHRVFVDIPFLARRHELRGNVLAHLSGAAAGCRRIDRALAAPGWQHWRSHPGRARVWFLRGGPGRGKSTVTQYFCQIQRAALVLQGDLAVPPKIRELAAEIREYAETAGFWPGVPRIPIYIELQLYAQWFGTRRNNDQPRGVLSYLAAHLSKRIEHAVQPGTVERALAGQSWVVVFDSLDEVPQDTRHDVAREVCHFVDEVAVRADADLLTICTSRPQGYAGHFDQLEGPTIELIDFEDEDALACAAQVIRLGRADTEAEARIAILRRAMTNAAVAQLMTTPLQAHIMAVIVRDGGEPPKRRWALFDRFYEVMYRREAAKELRDSRLAQVLRENAELIRAVHGYLGFVLHARAETSAGAVAHLGLDELRTLVRYAVAQRRDEDIDETVDAVLRAARERIVLINTPDDGAHVRFDIRQVQEFFAAEFLYSEFRDHEDHLEALRERLTCIGGDVHWREVMHFVLSGLIVGNHRSELGVAIEVLRNIDGEGAADNERILRRRLGIGARLVWELLNDGVLEDDRRVRNRFSSCLEPLAGSYVRKIGLNALPEKSRRWLLEHMFRRVIEADVSESVGAAALVMIGLRDGDERIESFVTRMLHAPTGYLGCMIGSDIKHRMVTAPGAHGVTWWGDLAREFLSRRDWYASRVGFKFACHIVQGLQCVAPADSACLNTYRTLACLARGSAVADSVRLPPGDVLRPQQIPTGWGVIQRFQQAEAIPHPWYGEVASCLHDVHRLSGFFDLAAKVLAFIVHGDLQTYCAVLASLGKADWSALGSLTPELRLLVPIPADTCSPSQLLAELSSLPGDSPRATWWQDGRIGNHATACVFEPDEDTTTGNEEEFLALLREAPTSAVRLWLQVFDPRLHIRSAGEKSGLIQARERLQAQPIVDAITHQVMRYPTALWGAPYLWSTVFSLMGTRAEAVRHSMAEIPGPLSIPWLPVAHLDPISLQLPEEHRLLVPVAGMLIGSHFYWYRGPQTEMWRDYRHYATMLAPVASLQTIADDTKLDLSVRVAAIVIGMFHAQGGLGFALARRSFLLETSMHTTIPIRLAILAAIRFLDAEDDVHARDLAGAILDAARNDFSQSWTLEDLLDGWRETSRQPAIHAQAETHWLARDT